MSSTITTDAPSARQPARGRAFSAAGPAGVPPPPGNARLAAPAAESGDVPRTLTTRTTDDIASLVGSALAALALVWIVFEHLLPWTGVVAFVVLTWITFVAMYAGVSALGNPRPVVYERLASAIVQSGALLVFAAVFWVIGFVFYKGWPAFTHINFYTSDMSGASPTSSLDHGGIRNAIVGSGIQIGIATVISLPLGVGTAVFLTEVGGRAAQFVRTVVEAMTALPDILAGLFIYTVLIIGFHWEKSGFAVSLALATTMIPIIARSAEVVLRVVPGGLREASLALGASAWQTVIRVVLPTARSGLATSLILGVARIAGETAPLLIVSGFNTFWNADPLHKPMNSLPLFIYTGVRSGEKNFITRGYGAAAVLLALILALFLTTRFLARDKVRGR
jgi:phosphate transport system permease protein